MRLHRVSAAAIPIVAWSFAIACNTLSGVDDLTAAGYQTGPRTPGSDAAQVPHEHDGGGGTVTTIEAGDGSGSNPTSLCSGLSMLIPFDGTSRSLEGDAPLNSDHGSYVTGKFGQAYAFSDGAPELDYDAKSGARISAKDGTISMWVDSSTWELPCSREHDFFSIDEGIYMDCEPDGVLGVYLDIDIDNSVDAVLPPSAGKGAWSSGFNHLVATWSSSPPSFRITLNGTLTSSTTTPWTPPDPIANVLYIGDSMFSPLAAVDDVAVWTRALSPDEIQSIYAAGKPVGVMCGIQ